MKKDEIFGKVDATIGYLDKASKMRKHTGFKKVDAVIEKLTETLTKDGYNVQLIYSKSTHFQLRLINDAHEILLYYHYRKDAKGFELNEIDIKQRGCNGENINKAE